LKLPNVSRVEEAENNENESDKDEEKLP